MIMSLREKKQFSACRFLTEFPSKDSTRNDLDYLMKKIDTHAAVKRVSGSGRPRTACTADNVDVVEEVVMRLKINQNTPYQFEYKLQFNHIMLMTMTVVI